MRTPWSTITIEEDLYLDEDLEDLDEDESWSTVIAIEDPHAWGDLIAWAMERPSTRKQERSEPKLDWKTMGF